MANFEVYCCAVAQQRRKTREKTPVSLKIKMS
jgi:hypothetical protein